MSAGRISQLALPLAIAIGSVIPFEILAKATLLICAGCFIWGCAARLPASRTASRAASRAPRACPPSIAP